jgi:hypothetical protein
MHLPVPRPEPVAATAPVSADDFAALARHLANQGGMTLVYAPSTTTITNTAPAASPVPVEVRMPAQAGPLAQSSAVGARHVSRFTLGEVVAYSGATLMGGATLSGLVSVLIRVPELVELLSGSVALLGMLTAIGGAMLDSHEREGARR